MNQHAKDILAVFKVQDRTNYRTILGMISLDDGASRIEGDEWKDYGFKAVEVIQFLGFVKSAAELAEIVRKDPLARYVVFRGRTVPVKVSMPVFIDGRNPKAFDSEFL